MADFNIAVALTLLNEGGYENDPNDAGNWTGGKVDVGELRGTKYGISASEFPALDIVNLTEAEAQVIYKSKYWLVLYEAIKDQFITNKLFDLGVLFGQGTAIKILQTVLIPQFPDVVADGLFGPMTLAAVNQAEPHSLLLAYKTAFVARAIQTGAQNPDDRAFVNGWIRRINS